MSEYTTPDGRRYRVRPLPGARHLTVVEREDRGWRTEPRWRVVVELPPDATETDAPADAPERLFSDIEIPEGAADFQYMAATLETARRSVAEGLLGLVVGLEGERAFARDKYDMDVCADLGAAARSVIPALAALDEAIDRLRFLEQWERG